MSNSTLLEISEFGVPLYSSRGIRQTLEPIDAASYTRRSINGVLIDLSSEQFRKYRSTISCSDQNAPAIDALWPGQDVTVSCVAELCYKTAGGSASRTDVCGSSRVEAEFTYYRPILEMRIITVNQTHDEWGAVVSWEIGLEEI